jgi:cation transporter-like permease
LPERGRLPWRPSPALVGSSARRLVGSSARRLVGSSARRLVAILGPDLSAAGQSLVALALNSSTSLVAGAVLGSITGTFEQLPGLLFLVPSAIGLRGNVFSALGSRLSTAIHSGQFRPTARQRARGQHHRLAATHLGAVG